MTLADELYNDVLTLASCLGKEHIDSVLEILNSSPTPGRNALLTSVPLPEQRLIIGSLYDCWQRTIPNVTAAELTIAIETAYRTRRKIISQMSQSLVWTGPDVSGLPARRTDQALQQVVQSAKSKLLIVTFAAYKVPIIVDALENAISRGVRIRFVGESTDEGEKVSFDAIDALGSQLASKCEIFYWPRKHRTENSSGNCGSLHAKVAVADSTMMLLSSANLTDYAMSLNMEMGILINGGPLPQRAVATFNELIASGVLLRR